jgi:glucan phosphoethanolaminetransferase (alkaline phosphatase superfamily)
VEKDFRSPRARIQLCCAWTFPTFLAFSSEHTALGMIAAVVIGVAPAVVIASLPARALKLMCVSSVLALPFTIWWCGFAALDGTGPGIEAARAALIVNSREITGAGSLVARNPQFLLAVAGHCVFLFLACRSALLPESARRRAPEPSNFRHLALLLSLLPLSASAVRGMDDFYDHKTPIFGKATLSSPLGSAAQISIDAVRLATLHHELGYRRRRPESAVYVTEPMLAIFIIGESARANTYGPGQAGRGAASKELAERIERGMGSWLPTTCASSDGTHLSVPLLLTALPPEKRDEASRNPTILGILKASGFSTAWVANNEAGDDAREAGHDFYASRWHTNPDQFTYENAGADWKLDEDMLPAARRFVGQVDRPKAMILHTIGNHISYKDRYPAAFFPAEPASLGSEELENLRYARAAEYGARTILQIAALMDSTSAPAFLVYTSDHGENLHSDHNGVAIHLGPRTTIEDGTVPSFVLWNRTMADERQPTQALSKLTRVDMIAHTDVARLYLTLAGVRAGPAEPTANPTTWGRISVGDEYSPVPCSALRP